MTELADREERAAQNELVFRAVNEEIVKMTDRFRSQLSDIDIVCECADARCVGRIRVPADESAVLERQDGTFLVLPGHEDSDVQRVLRRTKNYVVVSKQALAG